MRDTEFCIVGAGPAGLTLAYRLGGAGRKVLVIERDGRIGGLAKSFTFGDHIFDIGPKRFHTEDPIVLDFLSEIAGDSLSTIGRSTKVYFTDRFFNWPLRPKDLVLLPPSLAMKCFVDLVARKPATNKDSFEEEIKAKYGVTLYESFFAPYTEKFLGMNPSLVHSDWAMAGINRSIVDSSVKVNSLLQVISSLVLPRSQKADFLYPTKGGFGGFWETLASLCRSQPTTTIQCSSRIVEISRQRGRLLCTLSSGEQFMCSKLIWSGNVNDLLKSTSQPSQEATVQYLNTALFFITAEGNPSSRRAQWIYISDPKKIVSRVTCTKEFAKYVAPPGEFGLCCEVTINPSTSRVEYTAAEREEEVVANVRELGFLTRGNRIKAIHHHLQPDTYPIYHRNYLSHFNQVRKLIKSSYPEISLLGRTGAFWYNNSDHSIRMALNMAEHLLHRGKELDYRSYF